MNVRILDLIDFEKINILLEGFYKTTGFLTAILDLDGNVLSKSGWRSICTHFHRVNPKSADLCRISDTELAGKMAEGQQFHHYQCLNGLVDVAVPIKVRGEHIANLFTGQFFYDEPNMEFFRTQAKKYNFDEKEYFEALSSVPVVSKEKVKVVMDFLLDVTQLITEMIFIRQEQLELNENILLNEARLRSLVNIFQHRAVEVQSFLDYALSETIQLTGSKIGWNTCCFDHEGGERLYGGIYLRQIG